ncbi:putative secreted protein [Propionispora sp. 2/2-37]|uniref:hypothetical protein n=1 Tax=Propionispora sp. 2/2-37 TaxID=1677858 RepID=UPI0006BB7975|nr:hypothetical protein [Propionispora sp. 2/2-37]CUH96052.1 putative secreted protein [Propionispora sp. 2/2-37]
MRHLLLLVAFCLTVTGAFLPTAASAETDTYEIRSLPRASDDLYKGIPANWYPVYALKGFDAYAAALGSDWTSSSGNKKFLPALKDWVTAAEKKGWLVSREITAAEVGALLILSDSYGTYAGLVTEVYADKLYYKMPNIEGLPSLFTLNYSDKNLGGYKLIGLIVPRQAAASAFSFNAARLPSVEPDESYKGLPPGSPLIPLLKEFDRLHSQSIAWTDQLEQWLALAEANRLKVSLDPRSAKTGALLLTYKNRKIAEARLVKAVYPDRIIVEQSANNQIHFEQLLYSDLSNFAFYIYPQQA